MNKLESIRKKFTDGNIDKWTYIDQMYELHDLLFDYTEFMKPSNISSIEIKDDNLIFTFRDSAIRFICARNDKRLAPLDTLNFREYEKEELEMQLNFIEDGFNVFDIGANFGWYALHIALYKANANVHCFEPIPSTFVQLNRNIELNEIRNIHTNNFGFSDAVGTFDFYFAPTLSVNASLANVANDENAIKTLCHVKTLDSYCRESAYKVDFIKCDVEGAEWLVFKGGVETLKRDKPIVFTEMLRKWAAKFNYHPNDIIKFFEELNYKCYVISGNSLREIELVDESSVETNYFFLHTEHHKVQIAKWVR